jgi:hypothetical protein
VITFEKWNKLKIYNIQNNSRIITQSDFALDLAHHTIKYIKLVNYEVNERFLLVFFTNYVQVWHAENMTLNCGIRARITSTRAVEIFQNRILIIGTIKEAEKRQFFIEMWFLNTCELINKRTSAHMIASLKLINLNSVASSHYYSNTIFIWSLFESLIAIKQLEVNTKMIVHLESNKKLLVSSTSNGTLNMWNTTDWSLIRNSMPDISRFIVYLKLLPNHHLLTIDSIGNITIVNYKTSNLTLSPNCARSLDMKVIQVEQMDSDRFLLATLDGLVSVWNMKTKSIDAQFSLNTSIYSFVFYDKTDNRNSLSLN